jgi:hypothetical protein
LHHLFLGRYVAHLSGARVGKKVFLLAGWDPIVRRAAARYARDVLRHPLHLFDPLFVQVIGIIQPPDLLPDGRVDMCDGCPDSTWYDGRLTSCCRVDELRLYGEFLTPAALRSIGQSLSDCPEVGMGRTLT